MDVVSWGLRRGEKGREGEIHEEGGARSARGREKETRGWHEAGRRRDLVGRRKKKDEEGRIKGGEEGFGEKKGGWWSREGVA